MILYVPKLISFSNKLKINDLCVDNISKNKNIYFGNLWEDNINKKKLNQENMKKKKVSEKENEWKGVLQNSTNFKREIPEDHTPISKFISVKDFQKVNYYQVGESDITPDSFTVTSTNVNNEVVGEISLKDLWKDFSENKTLSGEEEHCNVGVNKDWNFLDNKTKTLKELENFIPTNDFKNPYKEKRVDFEFTPLTFWQLLPSIAVNLHCKEIELTWLCFGMYINFKRNG